MPSAGAHRLTTPVQRRPRRERGPAASSIVAVLALLAGLLTVDAVAAPVRHSAQAATSAVHSADSPVASLPDVVSAQHQARLQGSRVEIEDERTATSSTFANPDGTASLVQHDGPVWAHGAHGEWVPVDTSLRPVDGVLRATASDVDASFSPDGTGEPASITNNGGILGVGAPASVLAAPTVSGNEATYPLADGTSMHLRALPIGIEQTVVLPSRPTTAPVIRIPLDLHGLGATQQSDGTIDISGAHGSVVTIPRALMWGADDEPGTDVPAHTMNVDMSLSGSTLTLRPDMSFLTDPSVEYPVTIDPTYSTVDSSRLGDVAIQKNSSTTTGNLTAVHELDGLSGGLNLYRDFENFGTPSLPSGAVFISATLSMFEYDASTCTAQTTNVYPITGSWSGGSLTWANQPQVASGVFKSFNYGDETAGCNNAWASIDITSIEQGYLNTPSSNHGLELRMSNDVNLTTANYKSFCTQNSAATDCAGVGPSDPSSVGHPTVTVTYDQPPNTPAGPSMTPTSPCTTGSGRPYLNTLTPTLNASVTDPDGGSVQGSIDLTYLGGAQIGGGEQLSSNVTSGATSTWTVPGGWLANGTSYSWKARAYDGRLYSSLYAPWCEFTTDVTAPGAPSASSTQYPSGRWSASGQSASFTFTGTDGISGVDHYLYSLDNPTPSTATASGAANASATVSLGVIADGWHTLYAQAVDKAGNVSGIASYSFGVGTGPSIVSPSAGTISQQTFVLSGGNKAGATQATFYYRRTAADAWTPIPTSDVSAANGSPAFSGWPYTFTALSGNASSTPNLNWNATSTLAPLVTSPVQVAVCFGGSCPLSTTSSLPPDISNQTPAAVTFDRTGFYADSQNVGPALVNLLTGNTQISATDASLPGNQGTALTVARSFNTMTAATTNGIFGPGWTASLPVPSAGSDYTGLTDTGSVLTVSHADATTTNFDTSTSPYSPTGDDADSGMTMAINTTDCTTGYDCYELDDLDGDKVVFQSVNANPPAGTPAAPQSYVVTKVTQPGTTGPNGTAPATTFTYSSGLVSRITAPTPTGATCTDPAAAGTWTPGCRGLSLGYDANRHLTSVGYVTSDGSNPLTVDVACYSYDGNGRLTDAWDPRDIPTAATGSHPIVCDSTAKVRPTHYGYDGSGRIATITLDYNPASTPIAPWHLNYDTAGRLASVTRAHTDGSGTETTTVVYGVPTTPDATTDRPDLTAATAAAWAQTDLPDTTVNGTAVCAPTAATTVTDPNGDLRDCTISYVDVNGRVVNTANYSGTDATGWHIATTEYDALGHVIRTLTPDDRDEALHPTTGGAAALGLQNETSATIAMQLSTISQYTTNPADGQPDLAATFGPYHKVVLPDGTVTAARQYTTTSYDTGNEPGHPATPTTLHLPVTVTTGASQSADTVITNPADVRETDTHYWLGTDYTGWTYRQPMQTITDPNGLAITSTTIYDPATGRVSYTRMPSAANDTTNSSAGTTHTIYYSASTGSGDAACDNHPLWDGLVCKTYQADQNPTAGLPSLVVTTNTSYDYLGRATGVDETGNANDGTGQVTRTTTTAYGFNSSTSTANPYATTVQSSAVTGGVGAAVPTQTTNYDSTTGLPTTVSNGSNSDATSYDDFGRVVTYTDNTSEAGAAANRTVTTYDPTHGWVTQAQDGDTANGHPRQTVTYTYDQNGEHRGLATSKQDAVSATSLTVDSWTASYDANGNPVTQTDAPGVTTTLTRDETGQLTGLTATKNGGNWFTETETPSIYGQWRTHASAIANQTYKYDAAGRLVEADDTPAGGTCAIRTYSYNGTAGADSNRASSASYPAAANGACQTGTYTGGTTTSHSYDTADRLLPVGNDSGLTYDAFGRVTTLPANDTSNAQTMNLAYYSNDLVASETQGTNSQCYTLDVEQRLGAYSTYAASSCTGTPTATKTNHYDDATDDSPAWTAETADSSQWTVDSTDALGNLGLTVDQSGSWTAYYADLHGDIVATQTGPTGAELFASDYDEFGNNPPISSGGILVPATNARYGWLGGKQRAGDDEGGLIVMGVRLYDPILGRFLQTDPVPGGSANEYDYASQDPVNNFDLSGRFLAAADAGHGGCITMCASSSVSSWYVKPHHKSGCHHFWCHVSHIVSNVRHAAVHVANVTSALSTLAGVCPLEACAVASGALGGLSAGLYVAGGRYGSAIRQLESSAFTVGTMGIGSALRDEVTFGRHLRQIRALRGATHLLGVAGGSAVCGGPQHIGC